MTTPVTGFRSEASISRISHAPCASHLRVAVAVACTSKETGEKTLPLRWKCASARDAHSIPGRRRCPGEDFTERGHRGIAGRAFERRFQLADHVKVTGASLDLGLLTVQLVHEIPEAMKPRKIEIATGSPAIEDRRAAA